MFRLGLVLLCPLAASAESWAWSLVDDLIKGYVLVPNMSFSAGDASGRKHTFTKGSINMSSPLPMASSSKFPVAVAIAGIVNQGKLRFDTLANEVFPWWTKDAQDLRSRVTLRYLLSFRSGIVTEDVGGAGVPCLNFTPAASNYTPEACAQEIYRLANFTAEPGTVWSYHSLHLQIAGAMAAKAASLTMKELLESFLLKPLNMTSSQWIGYPNPHLAAAMVSTGDDYDKLLRATLAYEILPKDIVDEMEKDEIGSSVKAVMAKDQFLLNVYGHYSMCLYFECFVTGWSERCEQNGVHADPGAFGFWPLIDRTKGYYMQIVTEKHITLPAWLKRIIDDNTAAALPAMSVAPLRYVTQRPVEWALGVGSVGEELPSAGAAHATARAEVFRALARTNLTEGQQSALWDAMVLGSEGSTSEVEVLV